MSYNYAIKFKSLRSGTLYTVSIGGGTVDLTYNLKGAAQPFVTEEDSDEDMFTPIRTQTGYLRIIDDGKDADGFSFDWKDLIPATDTSRPVTLSHVENNQTVIDWQGFMQAQTFGGMLYGNPQEREFPIQCVLTVTQGTDINYQHTQIENFAYLLKQIVDSIPSTQRPTQLMIQGGADAQAWLLKKIDWQNFVSEDGDGNLTSRFSMYQCLEDMCRFWGWTARTCGTTMYLTMADDATTEPNWLTLTYAQLTTMAGGTAAGTTSSTFSSVTLTGDIFASTNQDDYVQRGHNKSMVTANGNSADGNVIDFIDDQVVEQMQDLGWGSPVITSDGWVIYTNNLLSINRPLIAGSAVSGKASFNYAGIAKNALNNTDREYKREIRILSTYNGTTFASLESIYEHVFDDGYLTLQADEILRFATKFEDPKGGDYRPNMGKKRMYMKLGIGKTRATAKWYTASQAQENRWSTTETTFKVSIGNTDDTLYIIIPLNVSANNPNNEDYAPFISINGEGLSGKLFVDFLGSDDLEDIDGKKTFEIVNFRVTYNRAPTGTYTKRSVDSVDSRQYTATNGNNVRDEWNADCIFASDNNMAYGYGVLLGDGEYMGKLTFGSESLYPEQHLANRVVNYWQTSKRRLEVELRSNQIADITPKYKTTIDGMTGYPIAISRDWRDDITKLTILEL